MSTAEFQRLTLIAAGVDPSQIPPILDTATWRRLLISAIANSGGGGGGGSPSGPAGGDLAGLYPNPTIKSSVGLSGVPTTPTATLGDNTQQISSTAFVQAALAGGTAVSNKVIASFINADSVALTRGTVVYAFGATGNKLSVKRADNTSDATSATTLGFVNEASVAAGAQGTVTLFGSMDQLNLGSPFNDGDQIYLGTNGGYVKTKPVAPAHGVFLGVVERANAGNGIAFVKVQNGYELDELHDVLISGAVAGQIIRLDSDNLWKNVTPTANIVNAPTAIGGHHATALSPAAGGQTYYFGYPHDAAAATTVAERGFKFPYAGKVVASNLVISITGTLGTGPGSGQGLSLFNKTTGGNSVLISAGLSWAAAWQAFASSNLSIDVNATDAYAFVITIPSHTVAPTSVRHYANIFFARS